MNPVFIPTILSTLQSLIPVVTKAMNVIIEKLPVLIDRIVPIADILLSVLQNVDNKSGDISAKDLGDKALQAQQQGDISEQGENIYDAVKCYEVDETKSSTISDDEKYAASLLITMASLEERYGSDVSQLASLIYRNSDFFNVDRLSAYLKACDNGLLTVGQLCDYYTSSLSPSEKDSVELSLIAIEKSLVADSQVQQDIVKQIREEME